MNRAGLFTCRARGEEMPLAGGHLLLSTRRVPAKVWSAYEVVYLDPCGETVTQVARSCTGLDGRLMNAVQVERSTVTGRSGTTSMPQISIPCDRCSWVSMG